jgi:hypothetical protein
MYKTTTKNPGDLAGTIPTLASNPFWLGAPAAQFSTSAMGGFGRVSTEWLSFVHRRMGEDARLAVQLADAKSPFEFWGRYVDFLQKAAQDYWQEYTVLMQLAAEGASVVSQGAHLPLRAGSAGAEAATAGDVARAA